MLVFRAGLKTLLLRMGGLSLNEMTFKEVEYVLLEYVEFILKGLRQRVKNQIVNDELN